MITNAQVLVETFGYAGDDLEFERVINDISNVDIDYGIEVVFGYYRKHGFPHYKIREDEKHTHMRKLQRFNVDSIFINNEIVQTMHCLRLAWTYFPHFWEVRCGKGKYTAVDVFNNDELFSNTIRKAYKYCLEYENGKMKMNRIRKI